MAATWSLRWTLSGVGAQLLPLPARCLLRALHKQVDGTEFQSIYSLDKLYPESKGSDTAWKIPVSPEEQDGRGVPSRCCVTSACPGPIGRAWSYAKGSPRAERDGRRGRGLGLKGQGVVAPVWLLVRGAGRTW